ncbi:hypothetical protein KC19_VG113900 [Ceratodon purpureus]|uniref:Uncharacterized protein n=1 Tax=Ceratodon purpureus TaxID=3225 RepID=A0A8T0HPY2_CERPU|nr:hypothetical protein KC19_VG113900 [Ceratodon purpureus]
MMNCQPSLPWTIHLFGAVYIKEVPPEFTSSTGWPGCPDCGIITSISTMKESPVRFERIGAVARSVGDGWSNFLKEHYIRKDKFVVFELVDERCLVAVVYPLPGTPEFTKTLRVSHSGHKNSAKLVCLPSLRENAKCHIVMAGPASREPTWTASALELFSRDRESRLFFRTSRDTVPPSAQDTR